MEMETTRLAHSVEGGLFVRAGGDPAAAVPLVFVHGLGESGLCFEGLLATPRLAGWRRMAPDLPGYGRSAWLPEPLSLAGQADRLADWLAARGEGPVVVAGHSMGGAIALLLAERHPERVAGVVDVEGNKSMGDCVFSGQAARQSPEAFFAGGFDELRDGVYRDGAASEAFRSYYASLRLADPRAFHANAVELVELSKREELAGRLAALPVPARYVAGSPDGAAERSLELVAEAGVASHVVERSGHWPFIDRPAAFLAAFGNALDALRS